MLINIKPLLSQLLLCIAINHDNEMTLFATDSSPMELRLISFQSWDSYIDNLIAQSGSHASRAAIIGIDGSIWTTSVSDAYAIQ